MDLLPRLAAGTAVALTVLLWVGAFALHRVERATTLRGLRNGAIVAVVLFVITAVVETVLFNVWLGLLVGVIVGLGYFWIGSTLIPVGLLFKSKPAWTTLGAWAAVPLIVVSLGFGYTSYRSVQDDSQQGTTANGTVMLSLNGLLSDYPLTASGVATCTTNPDGSVSLFGGTTGNAAVMSADGDVVQVQFSIDATAANPALSLTIDNESAVPSPGQMAVVAGSSPSAGSVSLTNVSPGAENEQPSSSQTWSGSFSWDCGR